MSSVKTNGLFNTFFNTSTINETAIIKYNAEINKAITNGATMAEKQQIMKAAMEGTNRATAQLIGSTKGAIVETEALAAAQNASTLAAKAHSAALEAASIAGNMIAFAFITKGIEFVVKGFDNWIHRVEKANETIQDAVSEYESAKSSLENINSELKEQNKQLDELLAKDKLTYAEQGQLEKLQAITKELLLQQDIEARRADKASKEAADKAVDAYKKQYGRYDKTEEALQEKLSYEIFPIPEDTDDVLGIIAAYISAKELLEQSQKEFDDAVKNGEDTTWLADDVQLSIDAVNDYKQALDENLSDLQEKRLALEDEYNKAIEKREAGVDPLTSSEKEIIETYESIYDLMKMVYEYTDPNTWKSMQIESVFDTEGIEKTKEELVEMVKSGTFDESTLQSCPKLSEALEQNKVSASELRNELEALAKAEGNVKGDTFNFKTPTSTFDQAWADSFTSENDKVKELGNNLLSLAEKGHLTAEAFNEADSTGYFKKLGISADEAVAKINKLVDESNQLSSMSSKISAMANALATKQKDGFVDADTLSGFDAEVRGLDSWDKFQEVLGSTASTYDECQKAANSLATEWVNNSDFLAQLTEQNKKYYETQLKAMGIENAAEVVTEALTLKNDELIVAKEYLAETGKELASVSELESAEFIASATKVGICSQQFAALQLQKILCNENRLDPANDINGLLMLAKAAEISGDAIAQLSGLKIAYDNANGDCVTCIKNLHRNDYSEIAFRFFYYLIPIIL